MKPAMSLQQFNRMQLGQIHKLGKAAGFDTADKATDSDWRQMLQMLTGKTSTSPKVMTTQNYATIINHLNGAAPSTTKGNKIRYKNASSRKLVMLWADIRKQGKLRVTDARLEDWLKSQYAKKNPDWMTEDERSNAISRLNTWQKRQLKPRIR